MSNLAMLTKRVVQRLLSSNRMIEEPVGDLWEWRALLIIVGERRWRANLLFAEALVCTLLALAVGIGVPTLLSAVFRRGRHHVAGLLLTLGLAAILLGMGLVTTHPWVPGRGDRAPGGPIVVAGPPAARHLAAHLTSFAVAARELPGRLADVDHAPPLTALALLVVWMVLTAAASGRPGAPAAPWCPARAIR